MGIYLQFWQCNPGGLADEFLAGPLSEFELWCRDTLSEFPHDIHPSVLPLLRAVQSRGRAAFRVTNDSEAIAVDRLLDTYFGMFCDRARPDLLSPMDRSLLPARHYRSAFDGIKDFPESRRVIELWNYIFIGRSVDRDPKELPYQSEDGVFHLSYWSFGEVEILHKAIAAIAMPSDIDPRAAASIVNVLARASARGSGLITTIA